jgi:hypothetical protein
MPRSSSPRGSGLSLRGAIQICNEQGSLGHVARAQGPSKDQVGPRQRPHTHITVVQIRAVVTIQGGQGGEQARLLAHNRAFS